MFKFVLNNKTIFPSSCRCEICHETSINSGYIKIIEELKQNNLLDKNYKNICCYCYLTKKFIGYNYHSCGGLIYPSSIDNMNIIEFYCLKCGENV